MTSELFMHKAIRHYLDLPSSNLASITEKPTRDDLLQWRKAFGCEIDHVYKYRCWAKKYHREILTGPDIFMSSVLDFEDQEEFSIPTSYEPVEITQSQLFESAYKASFEHDASLGCFERMLLAQRKINMEPWKDRKYVEQCNAKVQFDLKQNYSVFSFADTHEDSTLWEKHACEHAGFAVRYDTVELAKWACPKNLFGFQFSLDPVRYYPPDWEINFWKDRYNEILLMQLTAKRENWKWEREHRLTLWNCPTRLRFRLPVKCIDAVYIGAKCGDVDKREIISAGRRLGSHVQIFQANLTERMTFARIE